MSENKKLPAGTILLGIVLIGAGALVLLANLNVFRSASISATGGRSS